MQEVQVDEAEPTFTAVVDQARQGNPSIITRDGRREAVVLSFDAWESLSRDRELSFGRLLMSAPLRDGDLPERDRRGLRDLGF